MINRFKPIIMSLIIGVVITTFSINSLSAADPSVTDGCDLPLSPLGIGYLHLTADGAVLYKTQQAIGGFQFNVDDATSIANACTAELVDEAVCTESAAIVAGLSIGYNPFVLAYSMTGASIPAGCGTLINLDLDGTPTGLSEIVVSDPNAQEIYFEYYSGDGSELGCTDATACLNYDDTATTNNGSCVFNDCEGTCGGSVVNDACGVCDGPGADSSTGCCPSGTGPNGEVADCAGTCGGSVIVDCAGACGGSAVVDCAGACGGSAALDACGACDGSGVDSNGCCTSGTGPNGEVADCSGECGGSAVVDCAGVCGGSSADDDDDGVCNGTDLCPTTPSNQTSHVDSNGCHGGLLSTFHINSIIPTEFAISQNYPNPFNPVTVISFDVVKMDEISLIVYDLSGKEVITLVSGTFMPGRYLVNWNAVNNYGDAIVSGMYVYRYFNSEKAITKKMLYLK